jgi:hypothetical protein
VQRFIFAHAAERMHQRAKDNPTFMRKPSAVVEHPFAGLKSMVPRFVVRGIDKVQAEVALTVTAYNLKRVMNILTPRKMVRAFA